MTDTPEYAFELKATLSVLVKTFPEIDCIYIFGSRKYKTGSTRSDIDILLQLSSPIKPSKLRDFTIKKASVLDMFILENGKATSIANESYIAGKSDDELIDTVDAVKIYQRDIGFLDAMKTWFSVDIDRRAGFTMTSLPCASSEFYEVKALIKYFTAATKNGLPEKPYLGINVEEASEFIIGIIKQLLIPPTTVTGYGQAKNGWTNKLESEYDFQNLFWIVVKPWLPALGREEIELKYDGQSKRSDFSLFNNRLVIELKYIKDDDDKREVGKTLDGINRFYSQQANIEFLLIAIFVKFDVSLDDSKWESDFSKNEERKKLRTIIIRTPPSA